MGSAFTFINLKLARTRRRIVSSIHAVWKQNIMKLTEPVLIMVIMATVSVFLPALFPCRNYTCHFSDSQPVTCDVPQSADSRTELTMEHYTCPPGEEQSINGTVYSNGTFNEAATLLFLTGEDAIHHLFSRNTHLEFSYPSLSSVLVIYFLMACWAAGTFISAGLVVPMLFIGGLYGRMLGKLMVDIFGIQSDPYWDWIDPGALALIGAVSFFGGVSRLTMSLTVIMVEITNDIQFLLLIMVAIMVAKWVGDFLTHPLYHALLELKCIPFLDSEPVIYQEHGALVNLELYRVESVMSFPVCVLHIEETVQKLAEILIETNHSGFPVILNNSKVFSGLINRLSLVVILDHPALFIDSPHGEDVVGFRDMQTGQYIHYSEFFQLEKLRDPIWMTDKLQEYASNPLYASKYVNLAPYVNTSAMSVPSHFSLHRTYIIIRSLGLRHLVIVDINNQVVGIVTRKDLMGFALEERLSTLSQEMEQPESVDGEMR